ncbi:putative inorganic phosphate cotransporter [Thrips palmi]|uniref:Inorganic phosphate cotransporter n=1 Tax=Thrips palmi TaxID=161013 RepID=A0A6P8Z4X6_THRPL|nr:putative inorganic phosphate cotransporter [Thrips palmi]
MVHRTPIVWHGCLPQRYIFVIMGGLAIFNAYSMRAAMSVAITEMAQAANSKGDIVSEGACQAQMDQDTGKNNSDGGAFLEKAEFDWDEPMQGQVLGALFWGYVAMNVPSGLMSDRFGGKRLLFFGILICSVSTMLIPLAARHCGPQCVIAARFMEGLGETYSGAQNASRVSAACTGLLAHCAVAASCANQPPPFGLPAGNLLGQVVGTALSGIIISGTGDWASVFYVFGGIGLVWCAAFWLLCYDTPAMHPRISAAEREYIESAIKATSTKRPASIPWFAILSSMPVWALIIGQLGHDWALFTLGTELPKYMKSVLGYKVTENGLISALPNLATWLCAFFSGWLSDWLIRTERISIGVHRKLFTTFACFMPGVGMLAAAYVGCDRVVVVTLFCIGMAMMGPFYCSLKVNALDIAPNYSGLVMSIVNGLGAVSGIVSPDIVGLLIPDRSLKQWRDVFWVTFGVCLASSVVYCVFSSAEVQSWNTVGEGGEFLQEVQPAASTPEKEKKEKNRTREEAKV